MVNEPKPQGFYWAVFDDGESRVVEIDGDIMYMCGSDVPCFLENGQWIYFGEVFDCVAIIGPIQPPTIVDKQNLLTDK